MPAGVFRFAFAFSVLVSLVAGIAGGLARAGVDIPGSGNWLGQAVPAHAFLMICTFMGTVIGIERAVAVKHPLSFIGVVLFIVRSTTIREPRIHAASSPDPI